MKYGRILRNARWCVVLVLMAGCGFIADKDLIKIARVDDEPITRGDLEQAIRNMAADERPIIRTKGDVRRALENLIDRNLKEELAEKMREQGRLHVDREIATRVARAKHPEQFIDIKNPKDYFPDADDATYIEREREYLIDEEVRRLETEQAMYLRIGEAVENGTLRPTEEEFREAYELRKDGLLHPERVAFSGVFIPGSQEASVGAARAVRGRLATGDDPEDIADDLRDVNAQVLESGLEHDPSNAKYTGFWQQASGAEPGDILGPIYVTGWTMVRRNAQGQAIEEVLPNGLLVCRVTDHVAAEQMTLEEAKPALTQQILYGKMMDLLRKEHGVEIYENKLPDPSMYETGQSVLLQERRAITGR